MKPVSFIISSIVFVLWLFPTVAISAPSPVHVDFCNDQSGAIPAGWGSTDTGKARNVYSVESDGGKKFLHSDARGVSVPLGFKVFWNLEDFPVLQWEWRANRFPDGSGERTKQGDDSVLGLYVVFGRWPFMKTIKYIWSDTLPPGESFASPFSSRTRVVVLGSGRSREGAWVKEERDVLADYRRLFESEDSHPIARAIGVLTDSDNTRSHAVGDYGWIEAGRLSQKKAGAGLQQAGS